MKKLLIYVVTMLLVYTVNTMAWAANDMVQVTIPQFNITLNGTQMDSAYKKHPLLQYNDIVYIPITEYSKYLGISYTWNEPSKSYYIQKTDTRNEKFVSEQQKTKNRRNYTAQVINTSVHILHFPQNITFENKSAAYPILKFRDALYFPLTWQYAHEVFGWDYQWAEQKGLSIDSRESIRPELDVFYPGEEITPRARSIQFLYTYFSDGYAQYYKDREDPVFLLEIKIKGYPKTDFGVKFKEKFLPDLEAYTMPGKINQFWSAPNEKIENHQIDISHNKNIVTVPFVYLKDTEHKTEVQNCIVTLDMVTGEIIDVKNLSLEEAYAYNGPHNNGNKNA